MSGNLSSEASDSELNIGRTVSTRRFGSSSRLRIHDSEDEESELTPSVESPTKVRVKKEVDVVYSDVEVIEHDGSTRTADGNDEEVPAEVNKGDVSLRSLIEEFCSKSVINPKQKWSRDNKEQIFKNPEEIDDHLLTANLWDKCLKVVFPSKNLEASLLVQALLARETPRRDLMFVKTTLECLGALKGFSPSSDDEDPRITSLLKDDKTDCKTKLMSLTAGQISCLEDSSRRALLKTFTDKSLSKSVLNFATSKDKSGSVFDEEKVR